MGKILTRSEILAMLNDAKNDKSFCFNIKERENMKVENDYKKAILEVIEDKLSYLAKEEVEKEKDKILNNEEVKKITNECIDAYNKYMHIMNKTDKRLFELGISIQDNEVEIKYSKRDEIKTRINKKFKTAYKILRAKILKECDTDVIDKIIFDYFGEKII